MITACLYERVNRGSQFVHRLHFLTNLLLDQKCKIFTCLSAHETNTNACNVGIQSSHLYLNHSLQSLAHNYVLQSSSFICTCTSPIPGVVVAVLVVIDEEAAVAVLAVD